MQKHKICTKVISELSDVGRWLNDNINTAGK
jgi:hypothetical protein